MVNTQTTLHILSLWVQPTLDCDCSVAHSSTQVLATGTKLTPPSNMSGSEKHDGVAYLQNHASHVAERSRIVVIGAGAVGVQLAMDIKDLYPEKSVTLVHSRNTVMNRFHVGLNDLVMERCKELGIDLELGSRVKLPSHGYPTDGRDFQVELLNGKKIRADFAVGTLTKGKQFPQC